MPSGHRRRPGVQDPILRWVQVDGGGLRPDSIPPSDWRPRSALSHGRPPTQKTKRSASCSRNSPTAERRRLAGYENGGSRDVRRSAALRCRWRDRPILAVDSDAMDDQIIRTALTLIEDDAKAFVISQALEPGFKATFAILKSVLWPRWNEANDELRLNLGEAVERYKVQDREYVARLRRAIQRGEAQALATELVQAAAKATTDDRMKMLAAAAAGLLTNARYYLRNEISSRSGGRAARAERRPRTPRDGGRARRQCERPGGTRRLAGDRDRSPAGGVFARHRGHRTAHEVRSDASWTRRAGRAGGVAARANGAGLARSSEPQVGREIGRRDADRVADPDVNQLAAVHEVVHGRGAHPEQLGHPAHAEQCPHAAGNGPPTRAQLRVRGLSRRRGLARVLRGRRSSVQRKCSKVAATPC